MKRFLIVLLGMTTAVFLAVFVPRIPQFFYPQGTEEERMENGLFHQRVTDVTSKSHTIWAVYKGEKPIGYVSSVLALEKYLGKEYRENYEEMYPDSEMYLNERVRLEEEKSFFVYENKDEDIFAYLKDDGDFGLKCTAVSFSDGKGVYAAVYVKDESIFDEALRKYLCLFAEQEDIESSEKGKTKESLSDYGEQVTSVSISETIEKKTAYAEPVRILESVDEVFAYLCYGDTVKKQYYTTVEGDTIAGIGVLNHGMTAEQIVRINRDVLESPDQELLPGTVLCVTYFESPITVNVTKERLTEETVPYNTVYVYQNTLHPYEYRMIQEGSTGRRNVLYSEKWVNGVRMQGTVLSSLERTAASDEIIAEGTENMQVSGSGEWSCPVAHPEIICTEGCYVGHTGIDLVDRYDRKGTVYAMDRGVVYETGYDDERGNYIVIDHLNGYRTAYEHLSEKPDFVSGDYVQQNEAIGNIGMSGNAAGYKLTIRLYRNGIETDPAPLYAGLEG